MLSVGHGRIHQKTSAGNVFSCCDLEEPRARLAIRVGVVHDDTLTIIQGLLHDSHTFLPRAQHVPVDDDIFRFGRVPVAKVALTRAGISHQYDHLSKNISNLFIHSDWNSMPVTS